jgi:hypothetical protein
LANFAPTGGKIGYDYPLSMICSLLTLGKLRALFAEVANVQSRDADRRF